MDEIIDFEVKGNVIRFYLGKNGQQYGDDWNDTPYEHNAGRVYDKFIKGVEELYVDFCNLVVTPDIDACNSKWCKDDMIARRVPCVIIVPSGVLEADSSYPIDRFIHWLASDNVIKFYFGDKFYERIND